jgi:ATP-binding cassette subfamily B protein
MKVFLFIRDIFRKFPLLLMSNILFIVGESLVDALSIFSIIPVVDFLTRSDLEGASAITRKVVEAMVGLHIPPTAVLFLAIFFLLNLVKVVFQIFARYSMLKTKYAVLRDIMIGTFDDFFKARWYFFASGQQGVFLNTFLREIGIIGDAFGAMALFFAGILNVIFYLAVPFYLSWQVTSMCLVTALLFVWPFVMLGRLSYRLGKMNTATANRVGSLMHESISTAKVILGFSKQRKSVETLGRAIDDHRDVTIKAQTLRSAITLLYYPFGLFVLVIGLLLALKLKISFSVSAALFYSLLKIIPSIGDLAAQKNSLDNFFPSYEQVTSLRDRARELKEEFGDRPFTGFNRELVLDNVSFGYPDRGEVLKGVSMKIAKGTLVALVGESGSGKSTVVDMIMGFHKPSKGQVRIDGLTLSGFDISSYRRRIGYVPQDSVLFNMSIRDNLIWAKEDASLEEIRRACRQANAEEFINTFPNRYDTIAGDRGVRLSGGQVQRIALARAMICKPDILILDEATSALDTMSERLIQQAVENIAKDATVIVVAHRLSTIKDSSYIYVMEDGRIVEEGSFGELAAKEGAKFRKMCELQNIL